MAVPSQNWALSNISNIEEKFAAQWLKANEFIQKSQGYGTGMPFVYNSPVKQGKEATIYVLDTGFQSNMQVRRLIHANDRDTDVRNQGCGIWRET